MNILSRQIKNEGIWVKERKGFGQKKRKQFLLDLKGGRKGEKGGFERAERGERYDDELDKRKNRIDKMSRP